MGKTGGQVLAVVLLLGAAVARAQRAAPAEDGDAAGLRVLAERLGSASVEERERAQADLENVPVRERDRLNALAQDSGNAEAQARLQRRVAEMDDVRALNQQLMDVHIYGKLPKVESELRLRTGAVVTADMLKVPEREDDMFQLDGEQLAFCEVLERLSEQHPLTLDIYAENSISIVPVKGPAMQISHGAIVCLGGVWERAPQGAAGAGGRSLDVNLGMQIDPRVHAQQVRVMQLTVRDGENTLRDPRELPGVPAAANGISWRGGYRFAAAGEIGGNVSISGQLQVQVMSAFRREQVVSEPAKHLKEPVAFGGAVITLEEFSVDEGQGGTKQGGAKPGGILAFRIAGHNGQLQAPPVPADFGFAGGVASSTGEFPRQELEIDVVDAAGNVVHKSGESSDSRGSERDRIDGPFKEPLKVVLKEFGEMRMVTVPFEFKDVVVGP